jgi:hypothetical protein
MGDSVPGVLNGDGSGWLHVSIVLSPRKEPNVGSVWITTTSLDAVTLVSAGNGILLISLSSYRLRYRDSSFR